MTEPLDQVFAALADPTRRDLVARLAATDATVGELAEPYDMSMQAVSKHVHVLERAGLVTKAKDGQRRTVHLEAQVFDLMTKWIERYRREAEARYSRLDAVLAEMDADTPPTATPPTATPPTATPPSANPRTATPPTSTPPTDNPTTTTDSEEERAS